jgi:chorismate synthase
MSTGEVIRVRAAMKPISTLSKPLDTIDTATGEAAKAIYSAPTSAPSRQRASSPRRWSRCPSPTWCWEKFGGDSVVELRRNVDGYLGALAVR